MSKKNEKRDKKEKRLLQVSAYYKNNQLHGLGFTIADKDSSLNEDMKKVIKNYEADWVAADEREQKEIVETYFGQLEYYAQLRANGKSDFSAPETIICIANIWFLENMGFLKPDEYNGCVFLYEQ